jgi:4-amino-4-deoxy-L-arabinose transferase-like glycosyltransferase
VVLDAVSDIVAARTRAPRLDLLPLQLAVACLVLLRLAYAVVVPPNGDESYYWLWGGHLQLSYFDHAPMVGWTSAIGRLLLGWTPAGLHFAPVVTSLVLAFALYRSAHWLAPEDPQRFFWLALAIYCASPLLNVLSILNYPDHLLICFSALTMLQMGRYLGGVLRGDERVRDLYLGAFFMGLAALSKYNAVLVAAGMVAVLIAEPGLRRAFRSPHLYLAGALTLVMTLPVVLWNSEHRFASLEFHAADRMSKGADLFTPFALVRLIVYSVLVFSPFLLPGFVRFLFGRLPEGPQKGVLLIARGTALVSMLCFLPLAGWGAISRQVSPHWMVLSFLPFLLIAPFYIRSRWTVRLHLGWGLAFSALATLYYLAAPIPTQLLGIRDREAAITFGQDELGAATRSAAEKYGAELVVSTLYIYAGPLAFGMGTDEGLVTLEGHNDQIRAWREGKDDAGKTAIIAVPGFQTPERFAKYFDSVEDLGPVIPKRFGYPLAKYRLLLGRGFKPAR